MTMDLRELDKLAKDMAAKAEASILEQLSDFVSRGLIAVEHGPMLITEGWDRTKNRFDSPSAPGYILNVSQTVKLRLKDREYIEKLEKENLELRNLLAKAQR